MVNYNDSTSQNSKSYLEDLATATSSVKAHLTISNEANKAEFVTFNVTDISTTNSNYGEISVSAINYNAISGRIFEDNTSIGLEFTRTGEKGNKGSQGFTGFQGFQGYTGFQGFTGFQGNTVSWWNAYKSKYKA